MNKDLIESDLANFACERLTKWVEDNIMRAETLDLSGDAQVRINIQPPAKLIFEILEVLGFDKRETFRLLEVYYDRWTAAKQRKESVKAEK